MIVQCEYFNENYIVHCRICFILILFLFQFIRKRIEDNYRHLVQFKGEFVFLIL